MPRKTRKLVQPKYMSQFRCIGSDCEESCCVGFLRISVNRAYYEKYEQLEDPELRSFLLDHIRISNPEKDARYAQINMSSNKVCPFLDSDELCSIQKKLGEDYLCYTCGNFPRINNLANDTWERTAKMSCPEAARLALLDPSALKLEEQEVYAEEWPAFFRNQIYPRKTNDPNTYNIKLRGLFIELLKDRSNSLAKRIWKIGLLCQELDKIIDSAPNDSIFKFLESVNSNFWDQFNDEPFSETVNPETQVAAYQLLLESTIIPDETSPRYQQCFYQLTEGLQFADDVTSERRAEIFEAAYKKYYSTFMNNNPHILENYFINFIIGTLFPFGSTLSPSEEYVLLAFRFVFVRLHLVGMSEFNQGLSPKLVIQLIQSYARSTDHTQYHLNEIEAFLQATGRKDINCLL